MPQVEAWERVFIDGETYQGDIHSYINCTACHGGSVVENPESLTDQELMAQSHEGFIDGSHGPGNPTVESCANCHPTIAEYGAQSLHATLDGYDTALAMRSAYDSDETVRDTIEHMESLHCEGCHATCGECHVSKPNSVGGGLAQGHDFYATPSMRDNCTACHGSRVQNEYYGLNETDEGRLPRDVHLTQAQFTCVQCHSGDEMHGMVRADDGTIIDFDHRYDGQPQPACEDCHADEVGVGSGIVQHEVHGTELMSCQSCHSVAYTNCTNCHVERADNEAQTPFYTVESHSLGFYLGKNVLISTDRPYRYVPVRHVPVDVDSFSYYGENLLSNFDGRPTWSYATPHNIQRITPQTETCEACHENDEFFLTADKVVPEELTANADVIVDSAPLLPAGYPERFLALYPELAETISVEAPAAPAGTGDTSGDGSFWGGDSGADTGADAGDDAGFWGDDAGTSAEPPADAAAPEAAPSADGSFWGGNDFPADETPAADGASDISEGDEDDSNFWDSGS